MRCWARFVISLFIALRSRGKKRCCLRDRLRARAEQCNLRDATQMQDDNPRLRGALDNPTQCPPPPPFGFNLINLLLLPYGMNGRKGNI